MRKLPIRKAVEGFDAFRSRLDQVAEGAARNC